MKSEEIKRQFKNALDFLFGKISLSKLKLYNGWRPIKFDDFETINTASGFAESLNINEFSFTVNGFVIGETEPLPHSRHREIRLYENGVYKHSWGILSPKDLEPCVNAMFDVYVIKRDRFYISKKS